MFMVNVGIFGLSSFYLIVKLDAGYIFCRRELNTA
jgi:hypothetical protein